VAISGLYSGVSTGSPRQRLDLRVDVDAAVEHAQVLHKVSGDVFTVVGPGDARGVHEFSWRVDVTGPPTLPFVFDRPVQAIRAPAIRGRVKGTVERHDGALRARVTLTLNEGQAREFTCQRRGPWFRELRLDFDVCDVTVKGKTEVLDFREPEHTPGRLALVGPPGFTRSLSLDQSLLEAGIKVDRSRPPSVIHDVSKTLKWTDAELDDALREQLAVRRLENDADWPRWFMWGFLATQHVDDDHRGIMFDSETPPRQGCVLFVRHEDFQSLPKGNPQTGRQARALRR
jgi:hypothetical protein